MTFAVERTNDEVLTILHKGISAGWEQRYLLISDVHFDSPHCDRKLLTKHLDQAKAYGAGVICVGDWFDAMGGKKDKRSNKSTARDEDKRDNYFDLLVDHSVEYLTPYADNLVMFGDGNHETAILKHNETDLLERMARQLRCQHMGYSGFLRVRFEGSGKSRRVALWAHYHHGWGGGGPVTKAMIGNNRKAASIWADVFIGGHIHTAGYDENEIVVPMDSGRVGFKTQYHITIPGYKQEYTPYGGFAIEKGRSPRPLGAWWWVFYHDASGQARIGQKFERAN